MKPPLGRKVTTADADHCRTLKAIGSAEDSCCALDRLQWVRNGLTLITADDYNSKVLSERGGAGQRVGYTKTGLRASPNRITQNHIRTGCGRVKHILWRISWGSYRARNQKSKTAAPRGRPLTLGAAVADFDSGNGSASS